MEINSPSRRKYEQIVSNVSGEQAGSDQEQVRAYTCTFCQRGFSNAQALGGHMNIHRKDRAKLRQTEDESLPESSTDDQDTDCTLQRPSLTLSGEGTTNPPGMEKLHQLSLFSKKPSQGNDQSYGGGHEEKIIRRSHRGGNPSQKELDLELRLGPEPPSSRQF